MGGRQSGKGSEQVESYYIIASIKPLAVVKLSAFQRLYFLLSLLNPPFFFFSFFFLSFLFFYSTFPGKRWPGWVGNQGREGGQASVACLGF